MSKTYIGRRMQSFESAPQFEPYSRVEIIVSEDLSYTAGTDTGRTLTIENPWGTQTMADNILAKIKNFGYKPYTADGALLDPSAELGDGITANDLYSGIYAIETQYGKLLRAKVSAPAEDELESEYPYTSRSERRVQRKLTGLTTKTAELKLTVNGISATVSSITGKGGTLETMQSAIDQNATEITAKVSHTKEGGDTENSFGWTLTEDSWTIKANGTNVLTVNGQGMEIEGKITAKAGGTIGGFYIGANSLSYNKHTFGSTNQYGVYLGPDGIQLGNAFKVSSDGSLVATNGTFTGNVYAGSIKYGTGTDPVTGMQYGTVSGSALTADSVTSTQASEAIRTSLSYADNANNIFSGVSDARFNSSRLYIDNHKLTRSTISIDGHQVHVVTWVSTEG